MCEVTCQDGLTQINVPRHLCRLECLVIEVLAIEGPRTYGSKDRLAEYVESVHDCNGREARLEIAS